MGRGTRYALNAIYIALMVGIFFPLWWLTTQLFEDPEGTNRLTILIVDIFLAGMGAGVIMYLLGKRFPFFRHFVDRD